MIAEFFDVGAVEAQAPSRRASIAVHALMKAVAVELGPEGRIDEQRGLIVVEHVALVAQQALALLSSPNGRVRQVTEPSPDAANRLKVLIV